MGQTQDHRHRVLVAAAKNIKNWFVKVRKIKAIYHTLNLFNLDVTQKCLIAECWVPLLDMETIQLALRRGTVRFSSVLFFCSSSCYLVIVIIYTFVIFFRREVEVQFLLFLIEWTLSKILLRTTEQTNLLMPFNISLMHTVLQITERYFRVEFY